MTYLKKPKTNTEHRRNGKESNEILQNSMNSLRKTKQILECIRNPMRILTYYKILRKIQKKTMKLQGIE